MKQYVEAIKARLAPFTDLPIIFTSVINKQRIMDVLDAAAHVYENYSRKISTSQLNDVMLPEIENYPPPATKGKYIKIKYPTTEFHVLGGCEGNYIETLKVLNDKGVEVVKDTIFTLEELKKYQEDIFDVISELSKLDNFLDIFNRAKILFKDVEKISIDYAIMEPCAANGEVLVIPGDFGWNDVGSYGRDYTRFN